MRQLKILEEAVLEGAALDERVVYNRIESKKATFKSGLKQPVHSWFRLTPSFGPDLVDIMLEKMEYQEGETVLDPFGGASTTLIQCKLRDIPSYGFEINPLLHFIGETSLHWGLNSGELSTALRLIENLYARLVEDTRMMSIEDLELRQPPIHNIHRWWRKDVLKEMLLLKKLIHDSDMNAEMKNFFLLAFACVLVPDLTNITLGRLQLHFKNRDNDVIDVLKTYTRQCETMIEDLRGLASRGAFADATLFHTDATKIEGLVVPRPANLVITSPPYPNRYSYVWNTRPHLYFFDFFDNSKQAAELDTRTIGGTWGSATSMLMKGILEPAYPVIEEVVEPVVARIRKHDNLMANYVMKYFNLMAEQIQSMEAVIGGDVRTAYVVGNSEVKGVYVETDMLLARIFEGLGLNYTVTEVNRFRKRHSGVDLYESIVYARK